MVATLKKLVASMLLIAGGSAFALPSVTTAFVPGVINQLSDDFVELWIDKDGDGLLSVGDVLLTSLAMTSYAPSGVAATNVNELSVFSAVKILSASAIPNMACSGGFIETVAGDGCGAFTFGATAEGLAFWYAAIGGSGSVLPSTGNSVAMFFEDSIPDFTQASFGTGLDGTARMVVDLVGANGDFWSAVGPLKASDFGLNTIGVGIGSFSVDGTISAQGWAGWDMGTQITARGNLSRAPDGSTSPIGGDATFFLTPNRVPEPASLALVGGALLGLGLVRRRKSA